MKVIWITVIILGTASHALAHCNDDALRLISEVNSTVVTALDFVAEEATRGNAAVGLEVHEYLNNKRQESRAILHEGVEAATTHTLTTERTLELLGRLERFFMDIVQALEAYAKLLPHETAVAIQFRLVRMIEDSEMKAGELIELSRRPRTVNPPVPYNAP